MPVTRRTAVSLLFGSVALLRLDPTIAAEPPPLRFFYVENGSAASKATRELLQKRYPTGLHTSDIGEIENGPAANPVVAVGPLALGALLGASLASKAGLRIISLFTSRVRFEALVEPSALSAGRVTAIYAETSPATNLQLVHSIYGRRVTVGLLVSNETVHVAAEIQRYTRPYEIDLQVIRVEPGASVARVLASTTNSDVLLAISDPSIYKPENVQIIIESCYRRRQVLIGYAQSMVVAGAVASTFASAAGVFKQLDELLSAASTGRLPVPEYPTYWHVVVNEKLAKSMNVEIADETRNLEGLGRKG